MYLYNLTLQKATGICQAITGSFSAPKQAEIVMSRGNILELYNIDTANSKLVNLISTEIFGQIRKIVSFRLTGNKKDYIVVGSDSGRIVILEANLEKREFIKIHQETFGKTGVRRVVPGEYIATDPKGRAILIAAVEKQKFVYITGRDGENKMTISSALEAHKSHTICFDLVGLDVGYENPLFACLEVDYGDSDNENASVNTEEYKKILVYYEMDLGLNHVVRKNYEYVDNSAHLLLPVPGSNEGPGGVLVFCENYVIYKKANHEDRITPYPIRNDYNYSERGVMIVASSAYKRKDLFFVLVQSELGDIFKISLEYSGETVHGLMMQYFETIPVSLSLCVLNNGYLFSASETSNHYLYNIQSIGDNNMISTYSTMNVKDHGITFNPKPLKFLYCCEEIPSLSQISDMHVEDLANEGSPQIYTLCGKSCRSSLRILKQGLSVSEVASSPLPGKPLAIWTVKSDPNDKFDKYAIVSFQNATLVLSIEETVKEVYDSGFDLKKPSLHVAALIDNTFIQVLPNGIIHIKADKKRAFYQTSSKILAATSNYRQIAVALQEREILYFEAHGDKLERVESKVLDAEILSLHISDVPEGRSRTKFLAVGCADNSVRILSLEIDQCLSKISTQLLPATPESVLLTELGSTNNIDEKELFLFVGLNNGVLMKTSVDTITGTLSDTRIRYLGSKPATLFKAIVQGQPAVIANSSKPWLCYNYMSKYYCTSLNYDAIDSAASLISPQCNEGIVAISGNTFTIFNVNRYGEIFHQTIVPLRYTPRRMLIHPENNNIVIIESEQNVLSKREKDLFKKDIADKTSDQEYLKLKEEQIGVPFVGEGKWGSCIRMLEPLENKLLDLIEFEDNEAAFSACVMSFISNPGEVFLIVGTAKDMKLHPRTFSSASIIVFAFREQGKRLEYLHRTPVEDIPLAFSEFQGRLVVGVGSLVRLYELGKKKLLKKCETKKITSTIAGINVSGQRIFVNTMNESFHVLRYKPNENQFYLFADDAIPRWLSCSTILDYDTIAGCDKFENFFVYRLPQGCDEESEEDPMGTKYKWEMGFLHGAAFKLDLIAQFHRGDLITSMKKCSLSGGSDTAIIYATASGAIGVFVPFETREEVDFFVHLEMYLRLELPPLCGRDHQMYRSAYGPVKCVVDGDLCEEFTAMDANKQKALSTELDKSPNEIAKKLEEIKNKLI